MRLQCAACLEPTVAGERHDCSEIIRALRIRLALAEKVVAAAKMQRGLKSVALKAALAAYDEGKEGPATPSPPDHPTAIPSARRPPS